MVYLLIDTCSWKQLVSKLEVSKELLQIKSWVKGREVILLCPEVLKEEWIKHIEVENESISKSLKQHEKRLQLYGKKIAIDATEQYIAKQTLESQIHIIDELFKLSIDLPTTSHAKIRTTDNRRNRKAPFHNKLNSDNDSLLIFTALDYLNEKGIVQLYFLSSNFKEFAISENQSSQIHPDILEDYSNIEINYFTKAIDLIQSLTRSENLSSIDKDIDALLVRHVGMIVNDNQPLIDQLYDYIKKRYEEISFYPLNLLKDEFPFKVHLTSWTSYGLFTLYTDNDNLYDLFNSLSFSKTDGVSITNELYIKNIDDYKKSMESVIKALNSNLIFHISDRKQSKKAEIRFTDDITCDCVRCKFNRIHFQTTLANLNPQEDDSERDLIKKAYINYQVGNFVKSVELFEQVCQWAEKNNKNTIHYITKYNLTKLSIFLENYYWGKNDQGQVLARLKEINLEKLEQITSTLENRRLLKYVESGEFFSASLARIQKLTKDIRDSYYLQVGGGFSSNSTIWHLINEFATLDYFLNNNFIIYDSFKEFFDLFELFTEAVIASHAIPESQGSRLPYFDDYILKKLIFYGDPDEIIRYSSRYNLRSIRYKESSPRGETFIDVCFNMLDGYIETKRQYDIHADNSHHYFWNKYNRIFSNIIILNRLVDFDSTYKITFDNKLLKFLQVEDKIRESNFIYVRNYLWKSKDNIRKDTKMGFIHLILSNTKYHDEEFVELTSALIEENADFGIPIEVFTKLSNLYFDQAVKLKGSIPSSVVYFFDKANKAQKSIIKSAIESILNKKFDYELYYRAVMYNVINYKNYFVEFYKNSIPKENSISWRNAFINNEDRRFESVNKLINLCFKEGVNLRQEVFAPIRAIDRYYDWLMDLDNFDYANFNPFWILEYDTRYYNSKFRQCTQLKLALTSYLRKNRNSKLQSAYLNIYVINPQ